jgi:hypothetical protein
MHTSRVVERSNDGPLPSLLLPLGAFRNYCRLLLLRPKPRPRQLEVVVAGGPPLPLPLPGLLLVLLCWGVHRLLRGEALAAAQRHARARAAASTAEAWHVNETGLCVRIGYENSPLRVEDELPGLPSGSCSLGPPEPPPPTAAAAAAVPACTNGEDAAPRAVVGEDACVTSPALP